MNCIFCGKEHDGSFGTGKYCSEECNRNYVLKGLKSNAKSDGWQCVHCLEVFSSRAKLYKHVEEHHARYSKAGGKLSWNKGLTKETSELVRKNSEGIKKSYKEGKYKVWCAGQHLSEEMKKKISTAMVKAHAEGRAHNIGSCRWNNKPSYPESWFMQVIDNEFTDKNYIREYPFGKYSLDFAWVDKKKCIEIDGEQHQRFEDYQERDRCKDKLLMENGWQILRLPWKEVYNNPKIAIQKAKTFIED